MLGDPRHKSDQGFTLVEVLIAVFIFSLISVGTMTALTTALRGKAQMETKLEQIQQFEAARAIIKSDFENLILRQGRDALGGEELYVLSGGIDNLIAFTRNGVPNPAGLELRSELQRVAYVFESDALIRRVLDHENPAPQTETRDRILFDNLIEADMTFELRRSSLGGVEIVSSGRRNFQDQIQIVGSEIASYQSKGLVSLEITFANDTALTQYFELNL